MKFYRGNLNWFSLLLLATIVPTSSLAGYLTPKDWERIRINLPDYRYAESCTGVPWQVLAAVNYRESNLERYPKTESGARWRGGAFCMDRGGDGTTVFDQLIREHTSLIRRAYRYTGGRSVRDDFRLACLCAADEMKRAYAKRGAEEAIFAYNGRAAWCCELFQTGRGSARISWKWSAYANNNPRGMRLLYRWRGRSGKLYVSLDCRPGAVLIWREINRGCMF